MTILSTFAGFILIKSVLAFPISVYFDERNNNNNNNNNTPPMAFNTLSKKPGTAHTGRPHQTLHSARNKVIFFECFPLNGLNH